MNGTVRLADAFREVANEVPAKPAIIAADLQITYHQLNQIAACFARKLRDTGVTDNSTISLYSRDMVVSVGMMLASSLLGARFLVFEKDFPPPKGLSPTHFVRSPDQPDLPGVDFILLDQTWSPKFSAPSQDDVPFQGATDPDAPWWILHTSGTTGNAKFMTLSERIAVDRSRAASVDFVRGKTVFCSIFGCTARPFFVRAQAALLNGCTIVDTIDTEFMRDNGVNLVCASPRIAREWISGRDFPTKFAKLQVSGARLEDADAATFLERFEIVEDVYGASETNKSFVNEKRLVNGCVISIGKPADSVVEIIDPAFGLCGTGQTGTVRIRNPYMVQGYFENPSATEHAFQDGWFFPGDFASWGPNGALRISGRVDDLINLGGIKIDPVDVDNVMLSVNGVRLAACFRNPIPERRNELVAFVVVAENHPVNEGDVVHSVHQAVLDQLGASHAPSVIIATKDIPMTYDGMPRRSECQRLAVTLLGKSNGG